MADLLKLELITPTKVVAQVEVSEVYAPGADGEFGVLPGHALFISQLRPGELRYKEAEQSKTMVIGRGFADVGPDRVTILTDTAEEPTSLNAGSIKAELERDESKAKDLPSSDPEAAVLADRIERNRARLAAVERR